MKSSEEFAAFVKECTHSIHEIADRHGTDKFPYLMICHLTMAIATLMSKPSLFREMEPQVQQLTELILVFKHLAELTDPS